MRILAIGDIHGCSRALTALLEAVAPGPDDLLVALGDYVDRGPDSRGVLECLIPLHATGRLVALLGNHEEMMLAAREEFDDMWLACGGQATLASYGAAVPDQADTAMIPERHWRFLENDCVDWYETDTHFFVHANAEPDLPLDVQTSAVLRWERLYNPLPHVSGKIMICGHTKQDSGRPLNLGHTVCIDTGVYEQHGWLTCLEVGTGRYWQANQKGQVREDWLDEADSD
jgi:serine/threonine protein phosphatase 1